MEYFFATDAEVTHSAPPNISAICDLDGIVEDRDPATSEVRYTTFYVFTDDDQVFFGQIYKPKAEIPATELTAALQRVPDATVFPVLPHDADITVAPDGSHEHYIKRPNMAVYELYNEDDFLARVLLTEASLMERLARYPHPNIVRYHGVRVRRGRVTGLILDKHQSTLLDYIKCGLDLDQETFLTTLGAAVAHLHWLGLAHNDINPENIMVTFEKLPF